MSCILGRGWWVVGLLGPVLGARDGNAHCVCVSVCEQRNAAVC